MVTLTRAGWGARPPKARTELNPARVTTLFLHHTTGTYTDWKAATKSIQAFHMTTRGWNDIAYNWLVAPDGTKIEGRGWMAVGGHTKGHNSTSSPSPTSETADSLCRTTRSGPSSSWPTRPTRSSVGSWRAGAIRMWVLRSVPVRCCVPGGRRTLS
jgi:hypothetical protein